MTLTETEVDPKIKNSRSEFIRVFGPGPMGLDYTIGEAKEIFRIVRDNTNQDGVVDMAGLRDKLNESGHGKVVAQREAMELLVAEYVRDKETIDPLLEESTSNR